MEDQQQHVDPEMTALATQHGPRLFLVKVPRDLAVQIVGSDAGKEQRFRPASVMTKGATAEEVAMVDEFMQPFVHQEVARRHNGDRGTPTHIGQASEQQAKALKAFCLRYVAYVRQHLTKHPGDRHYRSRQRMDQAMAVVRQVNEAVDQPFDDGMSLEDAAKDLVVHVESLSKELQNFRLRAEWASSHQTPPVEPTSLVAKLLQLDAHLTSAVQAGNDLALHS